MSSGQAPLPEPSFAGLVATMAAMPTRETSWSDEGLADDVASISYEQALRAHARVRPPSPDTHTERDSLSVMDESASTSKGPSEAPASPAPLKTASITIRLSEPECAQLRRRAAEAGLSVSAYLRSCTLEVESLRAQVKQTLSELRSSVALPNNDQTRSESTGGIRYHFARIWHSLQLIRARRQLAPRINAANPFAPLRY